MQFECPKLLEYVHAANEELPEHLIIRSYLAAANEELPEHLIIRSYLAAFSLIAEREARQLIVQCGGRI